MSVQTEKEPENEEVVESPEIDFKPLVNLPLVDIKTLEENEEELLKLRAKLFRFETTNTPPEWKERGIGEVKIMSNKRTGNFRIIMRRDKTHKICANHLINPEMKLLPNVGSDRAWVYTVHADFADEEPKKEQLAIRFRNNEIALSFKAEFEKCQRILLDRQEGRGGGDTTNGITKELEKLVVNDDSRDIPANGSASEVSGASTDDSNSNNDSKPVKEESTPTGSETAPVTEQETAPDQA